METTQLARGDLWNHFKMCVPIFGDPFLVAGSDSFFFILHHGTVVRAGDEMEVLVADADDVANSMDASAGDQPGGADDGGEDGDRDAAAGGASVRCQHADNRARMCA